MAFVNIIQDLTSHGWWDYQAIFRKDQSICDVQIVLYLPVVMKYSRHVNNVCWPASLNHLGELSHLLITLKLYFLTSDTGRLLIIVWTGSSCFSLLSVEESLSWVRVKVSATYKSFPKTLLKTHIIAISATFIANVSEWQIQMQATPSWLGHNCIQPVKDSSRHTLLVFLF